MSSLASLLPRLLEGEVLTQAEAGELLRGLVAQDATDVQRAAALAALRARGERADEVRGMALAMREACEPVRLPPGTRAVDTCGTGGDGSGSFNVSTAAALLAAAVGVPIVKHGNRSVSSRCGSADLVEALGIPLATAAAEVRQQLVDRGFTFLFAPHFHASTAAVGPVRRALGVRTIFNLLGPLTNPAAPPLQLVGAWDERAARLLAEALAGMPVERCIVVTGAHGTDEATPCGPFLRLDVRPHEVMETWVDPLEVYGVERATPQALVGGDAVRNRAMLHDVFSGARSAVRDAVLLNTALVLELAGVATTPAAAFATAAEGIDGGRATWFLSRLEGAS